ncbi:lactonase family protein [Frondihabitans australicus]|uniref:6-phosphogluconolactonase (Cycloisomerase 2 family) n=1 Tax=Frondihabitans australicus TaxID=386892 RepID=A0A495ILY6_9MICO|nr:beta-propeller fold lactonase family protein [Frondihabitans australicus]RKR76176.1 6-phosphogluconolactonase (cycloisomerase 2 family) [Frondihabitans australicus]
MTPGAAPSGAAATRLYVGGYTASSGGHGTGISVFDRGPADEPWRLVQTVEADDPTFLALTEGALHAASETTAGRVLSYTIGAGVLTAASAAASGGMAPCHVLRDPASGALVVANYGAGTIGVLSDDPSDPARVTRVLALPVGHGPVLDRQDHPHAHQITFTPWGTLLVSDLGTDRVFELTIDPVTLDPSIVATHALPSGSGPRHFAWLPGTGGSGSGGSGSGGSGSGVLGAVGSTTGDASAGSGARLVIAGELDGRVHVLARRADGALVVDHSVPAYAEGATTPSTSADATDEALLSHVEVRALDDGTPVVYVAVRGRDTITVLARGADGRLAVRAEVPCGGHWPRHFAVDAGSLYVANQLSDDVTVLPLDPVSGIPGPVAARIRLGSPSCVLFA